MTMSVHGAISGDGESPPASMQQPSATAIDDSVGASARLAAIAAGVLAVLAPHESAWRQTIHASVQHIAEHQQTRFTEYWTTVQPGERIPSGYDRIRDGERQAPPSEGLLTYPRYVADAHLLHAHHGDRVHAARHGGVAVAGDVVRQRADAMFEDMRATFIDRAARKILHVAGARPVEHVDGNVRIHRAIEGSFTAHLDARNRVTFDAAVQSNYRYGENSANRTLTQYNQYPFRVLEALVDGTFVSAPSADELAVRWGGMPAAQAERARVGVVRAEKAAWTRTKDDLERRVDAWREVAGTVTDHAKRVALATVAADTTHPQHAKMRRDIEKEHAIFLANHSWLMAPLRPLTEIHPMPKPLEPTNRYLQRLELDAWPSSETAKAELAKVRTALAAHKANKPGSAA